MKSLSNRVKEKRKELEMSQAELGARAGLSQSTIAQIESGRNSGSKYLLQLADAMEVSVRWLQDGKTPEEADAAVLQLRTVRHSPAVRKLMDAVAAADEAGVPAESLAPIINLLNVLTASQKAISHADQPIDKASTDSKSKQVLKGRAGMKAALSEAQQNDQSNHERPTGTRDRR